MPSVTNNSAASAALASPNHRIDLLQPPTHRPLTETNTGASEPASRTVRWDASRPVEARDGFEVTRFSTRAASANLAPNSPRSTSGADSTAGVIGPGTIEAPTRTERLETGWRFKPTAEYPDVNAVFAWRFPLPPGVPIEAPTAHPFGDLSQVPIVAVPCSSDPFAMKDLALALEKTGRDAHILSAGYAPDVAGDHEHERHKFLQGHSGRLFHGRANGDAGAWTLDNPHSYNTLGHRSYSAFMVTEPVYPSFVTPEEVKAYDRNVLTWQVLAAISPFTSQDFNGRDNVATVNRAAVEEAAMMILAAHAGSPEAAAWVRATENETYCAEVVHLAQNTGDFPLNKRTLDRLEAKLNWRGANIHGLYDLIKAKVESPEFRYTSNNPGARLLDVGMAPEDLKPVRERLIEEGVLPPDLAFGVWTIGDMVTKFVSRHIPRPDPRDPATAQLQLMALEQLKEQFMAGHGMTAEQHEAFSTQFWPKVLEVVGNTEFPGAHNATEARAMFDAQLAEISRVAAATGIDGHDDVGYGAYTPPHMYSVKATEPLAGGRDRRHTEEFPSGGYLGLRPVMIIFHDDAPFVERTDPTAS